MKKVLLLLFCFVGLVGCASFQSSYELETHDKGEYFNIPLVPKDFIVKGFVYAESTVSINPDGTRDGSEITSDMLIKEAEKLGADDVVNVRIDKIENVDARTIRDAYGNRHSAYVKVIKYKAVGLAIKYK